MDRTVIAHFALPVTLFGNGVLTCAIVGGLGFTVYSPDENLARHILSHGPFLLGVFAIAWLCGVLLLMLLYAQVRQILFDNGVAVWIEGGAVFYLDRRWFSVNYDEITTIEAGSYGRGGFKGVIFQLKDGRKKSIPLGILRESGAIIIERLREGAVR